MVSTSKTKYYALPALKEWREARGWTQLEMCQMYSLEFDVDLAKVTYQKWEQGQIPIGIDDVLNLSRFTKLEPFRWTEKK